VTSDISASIVLKNGPNKNRACQADVPHHAESEGKTRHASGQDKVSQTPLWRVDLSINRALFRSMLGANNKTPSNEIRKTPIRGAHTKRKFKYGKERNLLVDESANLVSKAESCATRQPAFPCQSSHKTSCNRILERFLRKNGPWTA
jgi:hypothetical protein